MRSGVLASKQRGSSFEYIVKGYFKFKQLCGSKFADLSSTTSCSFAVFSSESVLDVDWDDKDAFGKITESAEYSDDAIDVFI